MGFSLLVGLLPYLNNIDIGIYQVLNDVSFCFLETFLGCLYTRSENAPFPCMSVSLLFDSVSFWNYVNVEISPVLDDISLWNCLQTFLGCWYIQIILIFSNVSQSFSWLTSLLKLDKYRDISSSEWCISTISEIFLIYCMSVSLWVNLLPCWNKANLGTSWVLDELSFWIS